MNSAFLSYGFRPFFLAVPLIAILAIVLWVTHLAGAPILELPANASLWHAHEMIFGLVSAAIAGFILTAITNWTGCKPLSGMALMGLFLSVDIWPVGPPFFRSSSPISCSGPDRILLFGSGPICWS